MDMSSSARRAFWAASCLCAVAAMASAQDNVVLPPANDVQPRLFEPGKLLVRFATAETGAMPSPASQQQMLASVKGARVKRAYRLVPGLCVVEVAKDESPAKAAATLATQKGILYAEPNYLYKAQDIPTDERFTELWGMHNTGQTGGTIDADIDAPEAWSLNTGSRDVIVAVIDTGIDYTHPDLAPNIWVNTGEVPGNGIDDDGNGYVDDIHGYDFVNSDSDPADDNNHGTHCAGTIGAVGNNGLGVAGVCWQTRLMAMKFLNASGSGNTDRAIDCIEYATTMGAKVLSNSWGGGGFSQALKDAIDAAGNQGVLFVCAAGNNEGNNNDTLPVYPSSYESPNLISVMATDHNDMRSGFSNYGPTSVDLGAPGTDILSCKAYDGYYLLRGTSMATPHVSGACALLWSASPRLSCSQVKQLLLDNVDPTLPSLCQSGGRLNLYRSLSHAATPQGRVAFNHSAYACVSDVTINLVDSDLATGSHAVTLDSDSGDRETVLLQDFGGAGQFYTGNIRTAPANPVSYDGVLQVTNGDSITVTYIDADDGTGSPATATDVARIDCEPPIISGVQVLTTGCPPTVKFQTNERASARVRYGLSCTPPYTGVVESAGLTTDHVLPIRNLEPDTDYIFTLEVADESGNTTADDNHGQCYAFRTRPPLRVPQQYSTIQAAIDAARDDMVILVSPGTYRGQDNVGLRFYGKAISLKSVGGPAVTIIDCGGTAGGVNFVLQEGPHTVLDGFTITDGNQYHGGAICCEGTNPTIRNCRLIGNRAEPNYALGGGLFIHEGAPTVTDCVIADNKSTFQGGGVYVGEGNTPPIFTNCVFSGNRLEGTLANTGAGAHVSLRVNAEFRNCIFARNNSPQHGAGICVGNTNRACRITNCIFVDNTASMYGGGMHIGSATPDLVNCIFWNNTSGIGSQVAILGGVGYPDRHAHLNLAHSLCQFGPAGFYLNSNASFTWGPGNLQSNPFFRNQATGDYHLSAASPCIDAGDNSGVPESISIDLENRPRFTDVRGIPDTGIATIPGGPVVDMGPYELSVATGDFDIDGDTDQQDAVLFSGCADGAGIAPELQCRDRDLDGDGDVDQSDFGILQRCLGDPGTIPAPDCAGRPAEGH